MTVKEKLQEYHRLEAIRIQKELDNLGCDFKEAGIVKTVLRARISQERKRAIGETKEVPE